MNQLIVLAVCVAAVLSEGSYPSEYAHGRFAYHGKYGGKCGNDGFYYKDHGSFVICSNGNAYDQPCAPGSRNSEHGRYRYGTQYYYRDFCDVNLVDYGAGISHGHAKQGHGDHGYGAHGYGSHGYGGYGYGGYGYGGYGYGDLGYGGYGYGDHGYGHGYGEGYGYSRGLERNY